jgi:hypothetical protein
VLFEKRIDINLIDDQGNNTLRLCNALTLKQVGLYLISKGIDFKAKNERCETPFDVIPEATEGFMVPASNKAIKARKKYGFSGIQILSKLLNGTPFFSKPKEIRK